MQPQNSFSASLSIADLSGGLTDLCILLHYSELLVKPNCSIRVLRANVIFNKRRDKSKSPFRLSDDVQADAKRGLVTKTIDAIIDDQCPAMKESSVHMAQPYNTVMH